MMFVKGNCLYPVNLTWILEMMELFSGNPPKTNMEPENDGF